MARIQTYIAFRVIKARGLKRLYDLLDDEQRPFEMVVYQSLAGVRPVAIMATNEDDAKYFNNVLSNIANGTDKVKQ